jgi:DNA-binding NarL/FixJ family response regulator
MKTRIKKSQCSRPGNERLPTRAIRTFLADGDPFMLALLTKFLLNDDRIIIVGSAMDGHKAFQPAVMSYPDLVLVNLHMPGLDGLQITRWLKQLWNPPVVFIVTYENCAEDRARSLAAGADGFLVKAPDLAAQIQTAIENSFPNDFEKENKKAIHSHETITGAKSAN